MFLTTVSVAGATVGVFSITPATASVAENSPGFIDFVVTRTASTSTESVYFSTILNGGVNTADYTSIGDRQLTFGPSATATSQTVRVQITPDTQVEANQTFGVIIQRTPNPDPNVFLDKSLFTILNDDVATGTAGVFSITPATASVAENSPGFIDFVVTRTASTSTESVYFSTILNGGVNTADYTSIVDRQLTFAPSSTATSQTVRVQITPDTQVEANQTFGVIIQRTPNPDPNVFLDKSLFTIVNDDVAQPTLLGSDALFSKNGGQYVTLAEFSNAAYAENSLTRTALGFDGWKPLASADLGGLPGLSNGMYVNGTAAAFLARSQDALVVSFRGTDSIWDFAQGSVSIIHYAQYQALLSAIEAAAGLYSKIYVTGHSLGAAVAQMFMEDHPDLKYSAVTFASPGSPLLFDLADSRTINFRNEDDPIRAARLTGVYHWVGDDKNIMFNEGVDNISLTLTSQHEMSLYFSVLRYLSTEKVSESWYGLGGIDTIVVPSTSTVSLYQIGLNDYFDGGAQNDRLIGSNARDLLVSGAGADVINGLAGADVMYGGDGNDTYYADHRTDVVTETNTVAATGGFDRIITTDSRTLGANIEYLFLSGAAPINGTGNTLSNLIVGNVAANAINGGLGTDFIYGDGGNDALTGGLGTDYFVFRTTPNATTNRDIITDFDAALDTIRLENTGVGLFNLLALGTLNAAFFKANAAGVATDSNDRIIYDIDSGALFYDTNGNAVGGAVQFAMLTSAVKPVLSSADFFVI